MSQQKPRRTRAQGENWRETMVLPLVTLPTLPAVQVPPQQDSAGLAFLTDEDEPEYLELGDYEVEDQTVTELSARARARAVARPLQAEETSEVEIGSARAARQYNRNPHPFDVLLVPGRNLSHRLPPSVR